MIYIAADHGGFLLKEVIANYLKEWNLFIEDLGAGEYHEEDDYPDYIIPVMRKVQESSENKAIVICRNGVGVSMLANKFKGIRAGISWNTKHAASSRHDDNTNVLALPADYITEDEAKEIVKTWLETEFSEEERHIRRLAKVGEVELA